jgi:CRP/FNR family transcriptional regulator
MGMSVTAALRADAVTVVARGASRNLPASAPLICPHRRVRRGEMLYRSGDGFGRIYVVRAGTFKCSIVSGDGLVQVTGFPIAGDTIGFDGIGSGHHRADVIALEDGEVFVLPFAQCEQWARDNPHGQRLMMRALASEVVRGHEVMLMLGSMRAEQKVAIFLLDLAARYAWLGYSRSHFTLRMTRQDIGSYLGLTLETVSRCLSRLQQEAWIQVQGKAVALLDFVELWRLSGVSPQTLTHPCEPMLDHAGMLIAAASTAHAPVRC